MRPARYHSGSIALHWIHAGLILTLIFIGLSIDDLARGPERSATIGLHKSLGLSALLVLVLRLSLLQKAHCVGGFLRREAKAEGAGGHFWHDAVTKPNIITPAP